MVGRSPHVRDSNTSPDYELINASCHMVLDFNTETTTFALPTELPVVVGNLRNDQLLSLLTVDISSSCAAVATVVYTFAIVVYTFAIAGYHVYV